LSRILLVNAEGTASSAGGAEAIVALLADGLAERGWEIEVLAAFPTEAAGEVGRLVTLHSASWRSSGRRRIQNRIDDLVARPTRQIADAVRAARPDVVHTHNLPGVTTAVWDVARTVGARVVHTLHDYYLLCPRVTLVAKDGSPCGRGTYCRFRSRRLQRWSGAVDDVVAVSNALLVRHAGVFPHARQHVIRHPWTPPREAARQPLSPPRTIGFLGTLDVTKGVRVLLDAAPRLAALGYEVRIAGDGRLRPAVEAAAHQLSALRYDGHITGEKRQSFLAECDVGLVPSVWDEPGGPPLVLLDWLGAGRPVLSSGRGGLGEVGGAHGVLEVPPTADALTDAAASLLDERVWADLRADVLPPSLPSVEEWLDAYEAVLLGEVAVTGGGYARDGQ